jgi:hypothetical protein
LGEGSPAERLSSGLEMVRSTVQGRAMRFYDVLTLMLDVLQRSLSLRRVMLGLRDAHTECLVSRLGEGPGAAELPPIFRERVGGPTFLLLPLVVKGSALGLIYADKPTANGLLLAKDELAPVRSLRDQAVTMLPRP